jgi:hypothetical protein
MQTTTTSIRPLAVLRRSSTGADVRLLQQALNVANSVRALSLTTLVVDGIFGSRTESVVRQFQGLQNLRVDGIVGIRTWMALLPSALSLGITQDANIKPFRVEFLPSTRSTVIQMGSVRGDIEIYAVNARARQRMQLEITSPESNALVTAIVAPDGTRVEQVSDGFFGLNLTGDYFIVVEKDRGNATYQLSISIR